MIDFQITGKILRFLELLQPYSKDCHKEDKLNPVIVQQHFKAY